MTRDVICDESEIVVASNNIDEYGDFLIRYINQYIEILEKIKKDAIQDTIISGRLNNIISTIKPFTVEMQDSVISIVNELKGMLEELREIDKYKFSTSSLSTISSILTNYF